MLRHPYRKQTILIWLVFVLSLLVAPAQALAGATDEQNAPSAALSPTMSERLFLPTIQGHKPAASSNSVITTNPVKIAWFYKPPTDGNLNVLASNFDQFVLTKNDEAQRDQLRAQGVNGPFIQYLRFEAIHAPSSCSAQPWRNQVADRPGDFCWIRDNHSDWFLRGANGSPVVDVEGGERFYLMDPANQGWRNFWLERARETQESLQWDGVFLDNVEASLAKRARNGNMPANYPDDASYQAAVEGFLAFIYTSYFQPQGRPLFGNIIELRYDQTQVWFNYLRHLDGGMEEGWAVDWSSGYLPDNMWQEHLERVERTEAMGKQAILVSQGARQNWQRQVFAFASYLLVAGGNSSFRYTDSSAYRDAWLYDNYSADLGAPLGPRYYDGYFWRRDFANGSVRINLRDHTGAIEVTGANQSVALNAGQ